MSKPDWRDTVPQAPTVIIETMKPSSTAMRAAEKLFLMRQGELGQTVEEWLNESATIVDNEFKGLVEAAEQVVHSPGVRSHVKLGAALATHTTKGTK